MISLNNSVRVSGEEPDPAREERSGRVREVGSQAVWSLSSCKPGLYEEIGVHCSSLHQFFIIISYLYLCYIVNYCI